MPPKHSYWKIAATPTCSALLIVTSEVCTHDIDLSKVAGETLSIIGHTSERLDNWYFGMRVGARLIAFWSSV